MGRNRPPVGTLFAETSLMALARREAQLERCRGRLKNYAPTTPLRLLLFASTLVILSHCGPHYLGDSKVEETDGNRPIYDLMVEYARGMEAREPEAILALVSLDYLENGSTTDEASDDYGYKELSEEVLPKLLNNVKAIQFKFRLTAIKIVGARAKVQYEYTTHFLFSEGGREGWHTRNDLNELELTETPDGWRIVSGL